MYERALTNVALSLRRKSAIRARVMEILQRVVPDWFAQGDPGPNDRPTEIMILRHLLPHRAGFTMEAPIGGKMVFF
jgi:hypothetical protein